jgi:hypothetical protein
LALIPRQKDNVQFALLILQSFYGCSSILVTQRILVPDGDFSGLPVLEEKLNAHRPTESVHLIAP